MKVLFVVFSFLFCLIIEANSQNKLTVREVYDFDINDEFHYSESLTNITPSPPGAYRYIILYKYFSKANDTVFYVRSTNGYTTSVNWSPSPHLDYSFYSSEQTIFYTNLDSRIDYQNKNWPNDTCNSFKDTI